MAESELLRMFKMGLAEMEDYCVCFPETNLENGVFIRAVMSAAMLVLIGSCGNCRNEVRFSLTSGLPRGTLLLVSDTLPKAKQFQFGDVIVVQNQSVWRLSPPMVLGRDFLPVDQARKFYRKDRYPDLEGRTLLATFNNCTPHVVELTDEKGYRRYDGIDIFMLDRLAKAMNTTWRRAINTNGHIWGHALNVSYWEGGIIGSLNEGEADIGMCGMWRNYNQTRYIDMTNDYGQTTSKFVVPRMFSSSDVWKRVFTPFKKKMWSIVIITIVYAALAMTFLDWLHKNKKRRHSFVSWLLMVVGQFLGSYILPSEGRAPARAVTASISVAALLFYSLYSSAIVSHLSSPGSPNEIDDVQTLFLQNYYWGRQLPVKNSYKILTKEQEWHQRFALRYRWESDLTGAILRGNYAILVSYFGSAPLVDNIPLPREVWPKIRLMEEKIGIHPVGVGFRKGSPLVRPTSEVIERLKAGGIINREASLLAKRLGKFSAKMNELQQNGHKATPLSITALQGAFFVLLFGEMFAFLCLLGELFLHGYLGKKKKKTKKKQAFIKFYT